MSNCSFANFRDDEDGTVLAFTLVLFILMIVGAGMAVDLMRHEAARADLQNALDRGVLAAAAFSQSVVVDDDGDGDLDDEYQELVREYMLSRSFASEPDLSVDWTETLDEKIIEGSATYQLDTFFLRLIGWNKMEVPAFSVGKQARNKIEVSLVLDTSGSMYSPYNNITYTNEDGQRVTESRITILKREAIKFVNYVLDADPTGDRRTFNIVPYSHQVAMTPNMARHYTGMYNNREHNLSWCMDFDPADYTNVAINPAGNYRQAQHFRWMDRTDYTWNGPPVMSCSRQSNAILPISNSRTALADKINGLTEENLTSVYQGMKWGAALIDTSARQVVSGLVTDGDVNPVFDGLPRDYDERNVVKVVVLMTDGENTIMPAITDREYAGPPGNPRGAGFWDSRMPDSGRGQRNGLWDRCTQGQAANANRRAWAKNSNNCDNTVGEFQTYDGTTTKPQNNSGGRIKQGDARLFEACKAAKEAGIVVYTIGFEAGANANRALFECASGDRFYSATGLNLGQVFRAIADDFSDLKLTTSQR